MDWSQLIDHDHLVISVIAILFIQLIIKVVDIYFKHIVKRDAKVSKDIRRAFKALRLLAGDRWPEIRDEFMKDEDIEA